MGVARSGFVTLDCADPGPPAEFWAAILGGEVMFTTATTVGVRTGWTWIAATAVPDYQPPTWPEAGVPKQIHLDLAVSDLDAAVAEAERLGAVPAAFQPAPARGGSCSTPLAIRSVLPPRFRARPCRAWRRFWTGSCIWLLVGPAPQDRGRPHNVCGSGLPQSAAA